MDKRCRTHGESILKVKIRTENESNKQTNQIVSGVLVVGIKAKIYQYNRIAARIHIFILINF